jgi:hypothetical protein
MIDAPIWEGVQSLLDNYINVRSDDSVILAYTSDSSESAALVSVALEMRGIAVRQLPMAPLRDPNFHNRLKAALPLPGELANRLVLLTFERDTMSHDGTIREVLAAYDPEACAVFRAISASRHLFSHALRTPPMELSARNTHLLERFMGAEKLRIETSGGTSLQVDIDSTRHRWISNRGIWRPGHFVILPAGEVATFPASIEGVLVADFAFNVNAMTDRDARLSDHPVTVYIERGRAVEYRCDDKETMGFLREAFHRHCAYNVGELGFGTNIGVETADDLNSHVNERRPGVHLGFGQHNQRANVSYKCNIHLDLIASDGLVWVDRDPTPIDLSRVPPSLASHPTGSRDEDVFSPELNDIEIDDCCGVLTDGGLRLFNSLQPE